MLLVSLPPEFGLLHFADSARLSLSSVDRLLVLLDRANDIKLAFYLTLEYKLVKLDWTLSVFKELSHALRNCPIIESW
jgi:hypothetical protein